MLKYIKLIIAVVFSVVFISVTIIMTLQSGDFWKGLFFGISACVLFAALLYFIGIVLGEFFVNFKCPKCKKINLFARKQYGITMLGMGVTGTKCRECGEMFDTCEYEY